MDRVPYEPDGKRSVCDRLHITTAGLALLDSAPKRQTYRNVLACSAKSLRRSRCLHCRDDSTIVLYHGTWLAPIGRDRLLRVLLLGEYRGFLSADRGACLFPRDRD